VEGARRRFGYRFRRHVVDADLASALILFAVALFLNQSVFVPNLADLNMWDEAGWISGGRSILGGGVPAVGDSPLVSYFYGIISLPHSNSPFWLVHSASLGRVVLFGLLWLTGYKIARRLPVSPASILLGLLLVTPLATGMLSFPSDPLYSALAGLSLWQALALLSTQDTRHAWASSIFIGLAALARNDGMLMALVLVPLLQVLAPKGRRLLTLAASALPSLLLIGGVVLVHGLQTGSYSLGTIERTYDNFESGQQSVFQGAGEQNAVIEARLEARRLFGTPEDNDSSILNAIRRNPAEFRRRLVAVVRGLPSIFLEAYGKRFGAVLLALAIGGIIALLHQRRLRLLVTLAAFTLPILSGFAITLIRPGHLQLWWFSVFALAAVGLDELAGRIGNGRTVGIWTASWLALAAYGVVDDKLAVYYGAAVMLAATWIGFVIARRNPHSSATSFLAVALAAGLVIRGAFPSPKIRVLGQAADEQAVLYLREHFAPGTFVAAGAPGVLWLAGMRAATLSSTDIPTFEQSSEVVRWMREQGMAAVYVDRSLWGDNPVLWELIESEIGRGFESGFTGDGGNIRVLHVTAP
jgi:hypothetical protein